MNQSSKLTLFSVTILLFFSHVFLLAQSTMEIYLRAKHRGIQLRQLGHHMEALKYLQEAAQLAESIEVSEEERCDVNFILGETYSELGNNEDALSVLLKYQEFVEKRHGYKSPEMTRVFRHMADFHQKLGNEDIEQDFRVQAITSPEGLKETPRLRDVLALRKYAGKIENSLQFKWAIELRARVLQAIKVMPTDNDLLVPALFEQSSLLDRLARYNEAEKLAMEAIAIAKQDMQHKLYAICQYELGRHFYCARDKGQAAYYLTNAIAKFKSSKSEVSKEAAAAYLYLGRLHLENVKLEKADKMAKKAFNTSLRCFGREHSLSIECQSLLARICCAQRKYTQARCSAEHLHEKVLALGQPHHSRVADQLALLAHVYAAEGQKSRAIPLFHRAIAIRSKVFGRRHPDVADLQTELGNLLIQVGQFQKAIVQLDEARFTMSSFFGVDNVETFTCTGYIDSLVRIRNRVENKRK